MADEAKDTKAEEKIDTNVDTPEVELDKATDVEGDLIDNPVLEEDVEEEKPADEGDDESGDESGKEAEVPEDEPDKGGAEATAEVEPEKDETGVYAGVTAADPGAFQPKGDYSFEVVTTDGKTIKIGSLEQAEAFAERLDENPELISASQFTKFNRSVARMDVGIEREQSEHEAQREQYELQQEQVRLRDDQIRQWNNEINYLTSKGQLPPIDPAKNQDWMGNAADPAVKARMDIFNWMDKENQARREAGIGEVTSAVDAFRLMSIEQAETQAKETNSKEAATRRAKGSMVGGRATHVPSNEPSNSIVGEGGNLNDLIYEAQSAL